MNEQLVLRERLRYWEEERHKAEEGERAALEEVERCRKQRMAADEALAHLSFSLEEISVGVNGNGVAQPREDRSKEPETSSRETNNASARQPRPRRGGPARRQRRKKQKSSVELVPELIRGERLSVGGMKRKAEAQGHKIAKQTLEYAVKKLMEGDNPTLRRYQAEPGSAANWIYGLVSEDVTA